MAGICSWGVILGRQSFFQAFSNSITSSEVISVSTVLFPGILSLMMWCVLTERTTFRSSSMVRRWTKIVSLTWFPNWLFTKIFLMISFKRYPWVFSSCSIVLASWFSIMFSAMIFTKRLRFSFDCFESTGILKAVRLLFRGCLNWLKKEISHFVFPNFFKVSCKWWNCVSCVSYFRFRLMMKIRNFFSREFNASQLVAEGNS